MTPCSKCGEPLYHDCNGNLRCESCDPPCPLCDDGGNPMSIDEDSECSPEDFYEDDPTDQDEDLIDGVGFADPGGRSALRAETRDNPRIYPCPTCGAENVLTSLDVQRHYCCDRC